MDDADLTQAICAFLARVPGWAGPDRAEHATATTAIFYGRIADKPDSAIGVRVYGLGGATDGRETRRVQLRIRGTRNDPSSADRLAGIARTVLEGISRDSGVNGISHQSFAPIGADGNERDQRTDNYLVVLDNLEATP